MNEKQIKTIQKVCRAIAEKYTFGFFDREDIEQEGFIIGMKVLPLYNKDKSSLETFLYIHISNKLKTFKRDNYLRKDFVCKYCGRKDPNCEYCQRREWKYGAKKNLMEPVDIDNVQLVDNKNVCVEYDFLSDIINQEIIDLINNNLDVNLRTDFLKILHGVYLPKHKRDIIENKIREILDEYDRE